MAARVGQIFALKFRFMLFMLTNDMSWISAAHFRDVKYADTQYRFVHVLIFVVFNISTYVYVSMTVYNYIYIIL